jgi:hypothetical protein
MPIPLTCTCGAKMKAPDHLAGKAIKCPKCQSVIKIPGAAVPAGVGAAPALRAAPAAAPPRPGGMKQPTKPVGRKPSAAPTLGKNDIPPMNVSEDFKQEVQSELEAGEKLIWVGRPDKFIWMCRVLWKMFIGIFCLIGATVVGLVMAGSLFGGAGSNIPPIMVLVPILFGVFGICMLFQPLVARRNAGKTYFFISTKRAVVSNTTLFGTTKTDYHPEQLVGLLPIRSSTFGDGGGDVVFRSVVTITTTSYSSGHSGEQRSKEHFGFLGIRKAKQVADLIHIVLVEPYEKANGLASSREAEQPAKGAGAAVTGAVNIDDLEELNEKAAPGAPPLVGPELEGWKLPAKFEEQVNQELLRGEKIVWGGKPSYIVVLVNALVFPLAALGLAGLAYLGLFGKELGPFIVLAGVVYGIYGFTLKWIFRLFKAARTCYVLTTRRAIVWKPWLLFFKASQVYQPVDMTKMRCRKGWFYPNSGDVIFYTETFVNSSGGGGRHGRYGAGGYHGRHGRGGGTVSVKVVHHGFLEIKRAVEVHALLRQTLMGG